MKEKVHFASLRMGYSPHFEQGKNKTEKELHMTESSEDLISCVVTPEWSEGGEKYGKSWSRNGGDKCCCWKMSQK